MANTITLDLDTGEWLAVLQEQEEPLGHQQLMVGGELLKRTAVTPEQAVTVACSMLPGMPEEVLLATYQHWLTDDPEGSLPPFSVGARVRLIETADADPLTGSVTRRVVDESTGELHTVWVRFPGFDALPYSPRQLVEVTA